MTTTHPDLPNAVEQSATDDAGPRESTERSAVTTADVTKRFGDVTVLSGVSLTVPTGTVTALIGPNGSGKTTLLRTLSGLIEPTEGSITRPENRGRTIGYLPQTPSFRGQLTVEETVAAYAAIVGEDDVTSTLARVGLESARDRRASDLSGGMTRLLGIATALLGSPPLVVLDEPTSGLDPSMSERVFDIANRVAADGTAVLLSSHDLELVAERSDHVVALRRGEVATSGRIESVTDDEGSLRTLFDDLVADHEGHVAVRSAGGDA
ncbi:ABC transporter ATP-binding protein [Haladaptatus sp. T7]|uniref:ABC transporter ATP-binding protein n=1 Tax=Haladaptatus sp. T7 TaxID=2029368 RepID=UPI0021A2565B|nr:ABC transporter ATP-binding protein [Haladaptatus sp. T7]GKZ16410.1 hypothetical protein HAL_42910 [Haladaptatus sp. T7]